MLCASMESCSLHLNSKEIFYDVEQPHKAFLKKENAFKGNIKLLVVTNVY